MHFYLQLQIKSIWKLWSLILALANRCFQNYSSKIIHWNLDRGERWSFSSSVLQNTLENVAAGGCSVICFNIIYMFYQRDSKTAKCYECWALLFHPNTLQCYYLKDMFHYLLPVCHSCFVLPKYVTWYCFCASAQSSWNKSITVVEPFLFSYRNHSVFTSDLSALSLHNRFQLKLNSFIRSHFVHLNVVKQKCLTVT